MQITALNLQKTSHIPTFVSMKITLLLVGKTAFPYINEGIEGLWAFLPLASKGADFQIAAARNLCGFLNF